VAEEEPTRHCAYCDIQVKKLAPGQRVLGRGPVDDPNTYVHTADSTSHGLPRCGHRLLQEHETYTVEDRAVNSSGVAEGY
jgi:hypothetical protein